MAQDALTLLKDDHKELEALEEHLAAAVGGAQAGVRAGARKARS